MKPNPGDLVAKLFPAVPAVLDREGRIHAEGQAAYVAHMAGRNIGGVAVWAHTGRGLRLDPDTRGEILRSWRAGLPDKILIAAAGAPPELRRPEDAIPHAVDMARHAAELGADALLVHPPVFARGRADQDRLVLEHHAAIAEVGLPLVLFYLYEAAGGVSYGPQVLAQLLARPETIGIKVATLDRVTTYQDIAALVARHAPDKTLVTGEDRFLGYSLMCGARSALIGMAAARVPLQSRFLDAYWSGDAATFLGLNAAVDDLARHTFTAPMEGYIRRMLQCLVHDGVIPPDAANDSWGPPLSDGDLAAVTDCLGRLGPDA